MNAQSGEAVKQAAQSTVPLTCHGHSRPVPHLEFSNLEGDDKTYYIISACKGMPSFPKADGNPMLRQGTTGDWIGTYLGHKGAVWQSRLSPDLSTIATASADFTATVWETHTGVRRFVLQHEHIVRAVAYPFDNPEMLATGGHEKKLRIWDLVGARDGTSPNEDPHIMQPSKAFEIGAGVHTEPIKFIVWAKDPNVLVTAAGPYLRWFDLPSRSCKQELALDGDIKSCEIAKLAPEHSKHSDIGGGQPVLTVAAGSTVYFWAGERFETKLKEIKLSHGVASVGLDLRNRKFVVGDEPGTWASAYSYDTAEKLYLHKGHHGPIWSVAFSPDGNIYATASEDGTIKLWKNCEGPYGLWQGASFGTNGTATE